MWCGMSVAVTAEWPNRRPPGIPRTAEGKVNLSATAPRTADGKPDLSGVWAAKNGNSFFHITGDLKPEEIRPWAAAIYQQREDDFRRDTDGIACLPPGPKAGFAVGAAPMKILQLPNLVAVLFQLHTIFLQIFTIPPWRPEDPQPPWTAHSLWNCLVNTL